MNNGDLHYSKKDKRQLSEFIAQEMLYDYVDKKLDSQRQKALEDLLGASQNTQNTYENLRSGLNYLSDLSQIQITSPLLSAIKEKVQSKRIAQSFMQYSDWRPGIRLAAETMLVVVLASLIVWITPWEIFLGQNKNDNGMSYVLTEVAHHKMSQSVDEWPAKPATQDSNVLVVANKESVSNVLVESQNINQLIAGAEQAKNKVTDVNAVVGKNNDTHTVADKKIVGSDAQKLTEKEIAQNIPVAPIANNLSKSTSQTVNETVTEGKHGQGFLYRAFMANENVDEIRPEIVKLIKNLGGQKAGNVELGWRRQGGSYFHFTIPESKNAQLVEGLKHYGKVIFKKDPHPRVMPQGVLRYILWIEEKSEESGSIPE